ncbi:MAG: hypothetical protein AAB355_03580 [Patescibacteria group bacterium]
MKKQQLSLAVALALGAVFGSVNENVQSATIRTGASSVTVDIEAIEIDKSNPECVEYLVGNGQNTISAIAVPFGANMTLIELAGEKPKRFLVETESWRAMLDSIEKFAKQVDPVHQASKAPVVHLAFAKAA